MGGIGGKDGFCRIARLVGLGVGCLALANCSAAKVDPKYGVSSSARVVAAGEAVPKGGGVYRVGRPYTIAGRTYVPEEDVNYKATGYASWYGKDFHGRYTANGEVFDMNSISAAHPTLPLPSYVRVTNLKNRRSIVVRVNDRGPYVGDRIIDLSVKTAQLLGFQGNGVAKVQVEYVGRAPLVGSDDRKLVATLREGGPASAPPVQVASNGAYAPAYFDARPMSDIPRPPDRPFRLGEDSTEVAGAAAESRQASGQETGRDVRRGPTTELAAATRPAQAIARAPIGPVEGAATAVSAYAPTRYDGRAGFMSGRGLY